MRVAHLSDLHYHVPPTVRESMSKRLLGLANLYVKGRVGHFDPHVAARAVQAVMQQRPDVVAITGDLTALATEREFTAAREGLQPLLDAFPTIIIPGNHDYYTRGSQREARIERWFGPWMRGEDPTSGPVRWPTVSRLPGLMAIGLNPCRPTVGSSGLVLVDELERLDALLGQPRVPGEFRLLMIHYPLLDMGGREVTRWTRRLNNRSGLLEVLGRNPVDLVIHGHDHLRYHNRLELPGGAAVPVINSGSSAFAERPGVPIPASFNVYEINEGQLTGVTHFDHEGGRFEVSYRGPLPVSGPTYNRRGDPTYGPARLTAASS